MSTKQDEPANPYSSPSAMPPTYWAFSIANSRPMRIGLRLLAVVVFLLAAPVAWFAFDLIDQEYLQIMPRNYVFIDFEFNGQKYTIGETIRFLCMVSAVMWLISAASFWLSLCGRRQQRCFEVENESGRKE